MYGPSVAEQDGSTRTETVAGGPDYGARWSIDDRTTADGPRDAGCRGTQCIGGPGGPPPKKREREKKRIRVSLVCIGPGDSTERTGALDGGPPGPPACLDG